MSAVVQRRFRDFVKISCFTLATVIVAFIVAGGIYAVYGQGEGGVVKSTDPSVIRWGFLAAAISVGVGSLAAGVAVAYVGAAALGGLAEKPELFGRAIIFVGLAEGIAIYGLVIAIFILLRV
ncbi:MAG: ATP synthase subunit C [Candidatus Aureabacteria bacterium]|nr:ATP synthase subunit C [Candidatus Auribacterota bacterium]